MKINLKKIIIAFGWLFFVLFFYSGISYLIKGIINSFVTKSDIIELKKSTQPIYLA